MYLTKGLSLQYKRHNNCELIDCYVDADWPGDNVDRKSTSRYVIPVFGNVIDWKSRKQICVMKASTYAEYVALSEAEWSSIIQVLINIFVLKLSNPVKIYEDNIGAKI